MATLCAQTPWRTSLLHRSAPGKGHQGGVTALVVIDDQDGAEGDLFTAGRDGEVRLSGTPAASAHQLPLAPLTPPPALHSCVAGPETAHPSLWRVAHTDTEPLTWCARSLSARGLFSFRACRPTPSPAPPTPNAPPRFPSAPNPDTNSLHSLSLTPRLLSQLHCRTPPEDSETHHLLISAGEDGRLATWCFADRTAPPRRLLHIRVGGGRITALALSPGGQTVAVGVMDSVVRLWSVSDGAQIATLRGHSTWVSRLIFHHLPSPTADDDTSTPAEPELRLSSGAYEGDVRVWDVARGTGQDGIHLPALLGNAAALGQAAGGAGGANGRGLRDCAELFICALLPLPDRPASGGAPGTCTFLAAASMGGAIRLWDTRLGGEGALLAQHLPTRGDPAYALQVLPCAPSQGLCTLISSHRSGCIRATRVRPEAPLAEPWERDSAGIFGTRPSALQPLYCIPGAHSDWATQLVPHGGAGGGCLLLSAGEDGNVNCWRGAPPPSWSWEVHAAFPDGFRDAVRTLLLVLHRLGNLDESEAAEEAEATAARGRRQIFRSPPAAAASAAAAPPLMQRAWLFGVTRDAIVDAVVSRLAEGAYPKR